MSDDLRLLYLAGILKEDMSLNQARDFLKQNGVSKMTDIGLKAALQGKDDDLSQKMVAVYRFLRANEPEQTNNHQLWKPEKKIDRTGAPPWAKDVNDWTIKKNDYTDANYLRKHIWELSGEPKGPAVSLWIWDGTKFTTHIVVIAKTSLFMEMAKAMVIFSAKKARAIFMNGESDKMILLYVDGRYLHHPIALTMRSENRNPNNDWNFVSRLPRKLADITREFEEHADQKAEDFKAWINVETEHVEQVAADRSYFDAIRERPKLFGILNNKTMLHARIAVERAGWVATGVNVSDEGVGAVVTAMTPEQAIKAARLLFKDRYGKGDWDTLRVKTNDDQFVCKNRAEIRDYLKTGRRPEQERPAHYLD